MGKNRGFISYKYARTKFFKTTKTFPKSYVKTRNASDLRLKRKKQYGKGGRKLRSIYPLSNVKSLYLKYRFNSDGVRTKILPNAPFKRSKYKRKTNLKRTYWKMSNMNKRSQQSRVLAVYNNEGASSFFKRKN